MEALLQIVDDLNWDNPGLGPICIRAAHCHSPLADATAC